ncbi:MAG: protoporphyrinogen oxidase [Verrucomicrobia bacterium]|nr:protoporphyrinogen oxidase [Verrucomicrobiota bacterium]
MAAPSSVPRSIAVLGAGLTGLTAAFRLTQRGHRVRLFESSARVGGAIRTEQADGGWLIEAGPNALLTGEPALTALLSDLDLTTQLIAASPAARHRYVVRHGRPIAAPLSPPAFLSSPLFSFGAKIRLLAEFLRRPRVRLADLSIEEFVRSHFGQELADYALNPFVAGVYAGNPRKLSARHAFPALWQREQTHGSLLRAQLAAARTRTGPAPGIVSFPRGLQTLPDTLVARLPVGTLTLNARLEALVPGPPWSVVWHDGTTAQTEKFDTVVAALPAPALATLRFGTLGERPLASLDAIEHPPVSSLFLGYRRDQVAHALDGFGLLVPEKENRSVLGVLFSSSLFPGRAPAGHVALTVMVGGTRQPDLARLPTDRLIAAVAPDLSHLLGVADAPVFSRHAFWPRAIPQYNLGHDQHLATMTACERAHPRFFLGGQARDGISLPACAAAGEKLALRAA